jgi:Low-density lipoprotein receptor repeat class B
MTATLTAASTDPAATATDALTGEVAPAIYWANAGDHSPGAGAIWTASLDGTSPHAIATGVLAPELQAGVAVNGSHLYWGDANQGAISEANLDGSSRHIIVTGQDVPQMVAVTPAGP